MDSFLALFLTPAFAYANAGVKNKARKHLRLHMQFFV